MLNPDLRTVLTDHLSRYSLVIATAKLARRVVRMRRRPVKFWRRNRSQSP